MKQKFNKAEMRQVLKFRGFDAFDDYRRDDKRAILGEMGYYLGKLMALLSSSDFVNLAESECAIDWTNC